MNNHLITIGIAVMLICILLSGCNESFVQDEKDTIIQEAKPYLNKIEFNNTFLKTFANSIIANCSSVDKECKINEIYRYIIENFDYIDDPIGNANVKTPHETIDSEKGDREDLAILFISLLENIDIKTYIVLSEDHLYALVYDVDIDNLWIYLEKSFITRMEKEL